MKKMVWGEDPELSGPRNWFRESLIIRELVRYKSKGQVLDFGCGSGNLLMRLQGYGFTGCGIDASGKAIAYLKKRFREKGIGNFVTAKTGSEELLYQRSYKNRFDAVVSGETVEHLKNDQKAVEGFYSVLKRGGICVVSVPAHMYLWDINDDFSSHYRRYEAVGLSALFTKAGFTVKNVYYWGFPFSFIWHKYIYLPMVNRKKKDSYVYTNSSGIMGKLLAADRIKAFMSLPFWIDELFNWTGRGGGLILAAEKA